MSLEEAIKENTAALLTLVKAINKSALREVEVGPDTGVAYVKPKKAAAAETSPVEEKPKKEVKAQGPDDETAPEKETEAEDGVSFDKLRGKAVMLILAVQKAHGRAKAIELLASDPFNAKTQSDIKDADLALFVERAEALTK